MKAAVLYGREDVRIESRPIPPVGPGEVRIRIRAALTCGTDLKVYRRGYHARMIVPPALFGHEFAGDVDALGDGVTMWRPGDRVVAANSAPCGACFYCMRNREELCENLLFVNGAYAEYITLPRRLVEVNLLRVPENLAMDAAALVEPLACVVHGMEETGVRPGEWVAVLGTGQIGRMFVKLCKLAGANVIAVGRGRRRLQLAERMGADVTISTEDHAETASAVRARANGGRGADRVVECVGAPETWELAVAMGRKGATINLFGGCPADSTIKLDTARIHYDALTLIGSFHHTPNAVRRALELIAGGDIRADDLIEGRASLAELPDLFARMVRTGEAAKYAIDPAPPAE